MGITIIVAAVIAGAIVGGFNGKTIAVSKNRVPGSWLNIFDWIFIGAAIGLTYGASIVAIRAIIKLFL